MTMKIISILCLLLHYLNLSFINQGCPESDLRGEEANWNTCSGSLDGEGENYQILTGCINIFCL